MQSVYICPKTHKKLYQYENCLKSEDEILNYPFLSDLELKIPDFLASEKLKNDHKRALEEYDQDKSTEIYRNFLDWLFQTFNEDELSFRRKNIEKLNLSKGDRVLLTGCGLGGDITPILEKIGDTGELYAQDLATKMVVSASTQFFQNKNIHFSVCDAQYLPFPDNFFDGAFHLGAINLFDNIKRSINEMDRVVKPGCRVAFVDEGIGPWLKETEYGRIAITNNHLWSADAPIHFLPEKAVDVNLSWILGNCFYLIDFEVSEEGPFMDIDVMHKGVRGGNMRSRYFGQLEGVTEASKKFALEDARNRGISVHEWLETVIQEKQKAK